MSLQTHHDLPSEFALTVACCRWTISAVGEAEIRRLAAGAKWVELLKVARRHRVQGLVWHALRALKVEVAAPVATALAADSRAIAEDGLRAAGESLRLRDAFEAAGIPLLFLKGLTVARLAYPNPFLKAAWDVDVLVRPEDIEAAAKLLATLGYAPEIPERIDRIRSWHGLSKESVWRGPGGMTVDLHCRLADQEQLLASVTATSPRQVVTIAKGVELPTLARDELVAYLFVHGASSAWFRLKWIADLAGVLQGSGPEEIEQLYQTSQELGAGRAAAQALQLAHVLFDVPLTADLQRALGSRDDDWLFRSAMACLLAGEPTARPLGTLPIHFSQFLLKPGWRYKWQELFRQGRAALGARWMVRA